MATFRSYYRRLFSDLGSPLSPSSAIPSRTLAVAENRLGVRIPEALREYYLIAGREKRFNKAHNELLSPEKLERDRNRLIFMSENQAVVLWGVSTGNAGNSDPAVAQAVPDEPLSWRREHSRCSVFLAVMLHWQAVNGGCRHVATASARGDTRKQLDRRCTFIGEVNRLRAYSGEHAALCLDASDPPGTLYLGARSKAQMKHLVAAFGEPAAEGGASMSPAMQLFLSELESRVRRKKYR